MARLERKHYLKHYLGGAAIVMDNDEVVTGQIEQVEMEDGSALIKSGVKSHWYDGKTVSPQLKKFKNLTVDDINCIVEHLIFGSIKLSIDEIISVTCPHGTEWAPNGCYKYGIFVTLTSDRMIWITPHWAINGLKNLGCPDNMGTIIFLLCEMGYDVTGTF